MASGIGKKNIRTCILFRSVLFTFSLSLSPSPFILSFCLCTYHSVNTLYIFLLVEYIYMEYIYAYSHASVRKKKDQLKICYRDLVNLIHIQILCLLAFTVRGR